MASRRTIASGIKTTGPALHAGVPVSMTLLPGRPEFGIVFRRLDKGGIAVPARYDCVSETRLGTVITSDGVSVGVVEHLMAAVAGAEIDTLEVLLDGPEPPILDGDALSYLSLIEKAGVREIGQPRQSIRVLKRVEVVQGDGRASLSPAELPVFDFEIEFPSKAIGRQKFSFPFSRDGFRREIAPARTFGFMNELDALNKMNLARGASLENTLAIDGDRVVNAELMRFPDEFVRHKILDAIGDMALAGASLIARFEGFKSGHSLNNALLRALFSAPSNYAWQD